jgi:hypothetical protein
MDHCENTGLRTLSCTSWLCQCGIDSNSEIDLAAYANDDGMVKGTYGDIHDSHESLHHVLRPVCSKRLMMFVRCCKERFM